MSILTQLGVNQTFWIQLAYFFIAYFFVSQFLVKPYKANLEYRKKNTGGSLDQATNINNETEKLVLQYQDKAKAQNETAQSIFEKLKTEGQLEEDKLISASRKQGGEIVDHTKKKIVTELVAARDSLKTQVPQISELIAGRVLGRKL
jgi:F0F1-type ATP synthase membrane subunit b/b'